MFKVLELKGVGGPAVQVGQRYSTREQALAANRVGERTDDPRVTVVGEPTPHITDDPVEPVVVPDLAAQQVHRGAASPAVQITEQWLKQQEQQGAFSGVADAPAHFEGRAGRERHEVDRLDQVTFVQRQFT